MAAFHHLIIDQGATLRDSFGYKDSDNDVVDLSGYSARCQIRLSYDSNTTILDLSTEDETIVIEGPSGIVYFDVPASTTEELTPGNYVWDLEIEDESGVVTRLVGGTCTITPEVTK